MPTVSTLAIRLAMLQLLAGFAAGAWLLIARGTPALPRPDWLLAVHLELALLGWTLQFAMGVAWYILPKFRAGPPRGREGPAAVAVACLNGGVLLVLAGAVGQLPTLVLLGRGGELAAVALFATNAWPRVKAFGT